MPDYFTPETIVLAHRGDSARFPENTMPAFRSAVNMQVHLIETDVHLTADGQVVIWHDDTLERMSGDPRRLTQLTWKEIRKVDAGALFTDDGGRTYPFKGQKISPMLLKELLTEFPHMRFNIDLKDKTLKLAEAYSLILKNLNCIDRVVTASFHNSVLQHFRNIIPEALTSATSYEVLKLLLFYRSGLSAHPLSHTKRILQVPEYSGIIKIVTPGFVKYLHKRGYKIQVWTVNETDDMNRLLNMGVDGLFTDTPALLLELLQKRTK